jgi:uncharacterized membrane protein
MGLMAGGPLAAQTAEHIGESIMWALGLIVGALAGGAVGHGAGAFVGAIVGLVAGIVIGSQRKGVKRRLDALEQQMLSLEARLKAQDGRSAPSGAATIAPADESAVPIAFAAADVGPKASSPAETESVGVAAAASASSQAAQMNVDASAAASAGVAPAPALPVRQGGRPGVTVPAAVPSLEPPSRPSPRPAWLAWILGGNTLARIGVLLLFIGVAFLLKYASEHVHVPIEMRLSAVAAGAIALLVVGWRLRVRRGAYAMILQGGAVGLLYLTVFAALKLYAVLPPWATIVLLLLIAALSSSLAVLQDAIALAVIGIIGGFLAPVLTATNSGDHVVLFSYYALLNAAIFGIAWFKSWRSLNLLGFVFTFVVGTLWGVTKYRPEDFSTTEPFLILFFLFYVGIAVLYALRRTVELRSPIDATLVFGTPLVAAALQSALVRDMPFGMALSALAISAIYLGLARVLFSRLGEGMRLPAESFLALGVIFATLAIPLALDARWTSASWALEGAAMLWAGLRQRRWQVRAFGILLQLGAGAAFGRGMMLWSASGTIATVPMLNSDFVGATLLGLAGLYSAWLLSRERAMLRQPEQAASPLLFAWGCAWWLAAGSREIVRWVPPDMQLAAFVMFLALTAAAFAFAERRLAWSLARIPTLVLLPLLLLIAIGGAAPPHGTPTHLFAHGGFVAWLLAIFVQVAMLWRLDRAAPVAGAWNVPIGLWHAGTLWLVLIIGAHELAWAARAVGDGDGVWTIAPWGLVPALGLLAVSRWSGSSSWPVAAHRRAYLLIAAAAVAVALALWTLKANLNGDGDPLPLPYLPLFNPLDLTQAVAFVAVAIWLAAWTRFDDTLPAPVQPGVAIAFAALLFVWINALVLRTIHFWFDVPYDAHSLWRSMLVQASFSLLWSVIALATMLLAHRRRWRAAWVAGATLLGVVVVKLFLVDLGQAGGVERIVSFIGVGLLLLLIGYLAPVPPRISEEAK